MAYHTDHGGEIMARICVRAVRRPFSRLDWFRIQDLLPSSFEKSLKSSGRYEYAVRPWPQLGINWYDRAERPHGR